MDSYTEKNLKINDLETHLDNIKIEKMSSTSNDSNNDNNFNDDGSGSIGLDLLANHKKMYKIDEKKDKELHEEIDLVKPTQNNNDVNLQNKDSSESDNYDNITKKDYNNSEDDYKEDDYKEDDYKDSYKNDYNSNDYKNDEKQPTLDEILEEKKKMLYEFERLRRRGIPVNNNFTLATNLEDMKFEYEKIKKQREVDNSIQFSRKMLMAFVTAIEFLNNRFDPFELKLDGWSEQVHEGLGEYDDIFEELHEKYKSTGKVSPEIKLILTLGGSAFMFHLTNNIFKSAMPQFQNMAANNPDPINNMMNKPQEQKPQKNPMGGGMGGGMDIGGILGMMSGLGGMGGGMGGLAEAMGGMGGGMGDNIQEIKEQKKTMEGPQGVETLLESLSANNSKSIYVDKHKKKGLNM